MKHFDFNGEVLTPLFLGGADSRGHPELRGPSVRGAMRFWYRAVLGGSTLIASGDETAQRDNLRELEADVFGDTKRGSAISVIVRGDTQSEIDTFQKDRAIRTADGNYLPSGKDYLLWSMAASGRPGTPRYLPDRKYIRPGAQFYVRLQSRTIGDDSALRKGAASLWLMANLGALGARANRGAGSIQVSAENASQGPVSFRLCQSAEDLQSYLSTGIRSCLSLIGGAAATWRHVTTMPPYDVFAPNVAEVWVVSNSKDGWPSAVEALDGIGAKLRDYRSHQSPLGRADHDAVLRWLEDNGPTPQIKRAAFGLPIPFRYSEGGPSDVIISEVSDRRASPLHIRITRLATGSYVGVLVLFKSRFLEQGSKLQLQTRKWKAPPPADYQVVQDFIRTFEVRKEVVL